MHAITTSLMNMGYKSYAGTPLQVYNDLLVDSYGAYVLCLVDSLISRISELKDRTSTLFSKDIAAMKSEAAPFLGYALKRPDSLRLQHQREDVLTEISLFYEYVVGFFYTEMTQNRRSQKTDALVTALTITAEDIFFFIKYCSPSEIIPFIEIGRSIAFSLTGLADSYRGKAELMGVSVNLYEEGKSLLTRLFDYSIRSGFPDEAGLILNEVDGAYKRLVEESNLASGWRGVDPPYLRGIKPCYHYINERHTAIGQMQTRMLNLINSPSFSDLALYNASVAKSF